MQGTIVREWLHLEPKRALKIMFEMEMVICFIFHFEYVFLNYFQFIWKNKMCLTYSIQIDKCYGV